MSTTWESIAAEMKQRHDDALEFGQVIEVNEGFQTIFVGFNSHHEYLFQGEDAEEMMSEYRKSPLSNFLHIEEYILASAQSW